MSMLGLLVSSGSEEKIFSDDVFQSYVRTGTGASATITTAIDLSTYGGLVWTKGRSGATDHKLTDTVCGVTKGLITNTTAAQTTDTNGITAVSTTGHTVGTDSNYNTNAATYVDWVFRKAAKFFDIVSYTGNGTSSQVISHNLGIAPGMIIVKNIDGSSNWSVYHNGLGINKLLWLNTTDAWTSTSYFPTSPTNLNFTVGSGVAPINQNGYRYVAYLFSHDTSTDGIIQCGSFSGSTTTILGWEPQWIMIKRTDSTGDWIVIDSARGCSVGNMDAVLYPNLSNAESIANDYIDFTATGFISKNLTGTYIYIAIRRSNKPPTSGAQVYNAIARTGTGAAAIITGVGFAPDLDIGKERGSTGAANFTDRLRGATYELLSSSASAESVYVNDLTSFSIDGISLGSGASGQKNTNTSTYIEYFLKRAPGVFSILCYTGTGGNKTETHNLGVAPELWLVKSRSAATGWVFGSSLLNATEYVACPSPNGRVTDITMWNSTYPTASALSLGASSTTNANTASFVCYMWASLAGISKVFTYTGNGMIQDINCGFSTGARFVMIIRVTATTAQDIFLWDSTRGIIAANDPHLSLNSTAAEVTTDDSIDPLTSGFTINQVAATNVNVNGAVYIGLAYS